MNLIITQKPVLSKLYNTSIILPFITTEDGTEAVQHTGLKNFMLQLSSTLAKQGSYIDISYTSISDQLMHSVVDCTITLGNYKVTETGETTATSLKTNIAREYPYLEAQKRAYDRAVISFLQLQLDRRRLYSDSEINN